MTFEKVYVPPTTGIETALPSTRTVESWYPEAGVMVKTCDPPEVTLVAPEGVIVPFAPAVAVIVKDPEVEPPPLEGLYSAAPRLHVVLVFPLMSMLNV